MVEHNFYLVVYQGHRKNFLSTQTLSTINLTRYKSFLDLVGVVSNKIRICLATKTNNLMRYYN